MTRPTNDQELTERRMQRHESHIHATYAAFQRRLCELGAMDALLAESAAISVLSTLERRILPKEAKDLEAQLPRLLVEFLPPQDQRPSKPHRFGLEEFLNSVAEDLHMPVQDVEPIVRAVFQAFREQISEGESDDVASNLPPDLRALWRPEH